jgi:hypothetical protein
LSTDEESGECLIRKFDPVDTVREASDTRSNS